MRQLILFCLVLPFVLSCGNETFNNKLSSEHHLELDATSSEIRGLLTNDQIKKAGALKPIIQMGERNLKWISHINSKLPSGSAPLSFSNEANMSYTTIDQPAVYSDKLVLKNFELLKTELPPQMARVIIDGKKITDVPPIGTDDYLKWGYEVDKLYQTAVRWIYMQPALWQLAMERMNDVRGWYFLQKETNLDSKLSNFSKLEKATQDQYSEWLVEVCMNNNIQIAAAKKLLSEAIAGNSVLEFYRKYEPKARNNYQRRFTVTVPRDDISWTSSDPDVLHFFMVESTKPKITSFIKQNVEEEWRWLNWGLKITFDPKAATKVVFKSGEMPNAGINVITMDANEPLSEWNTQWAIRHEFGHLLGFPDCYLEFYIQETGEIMQYQLDVDNIMCSRHGRFQEIHYRELKKAYYKP